LGLGYITVKVTFLMMLGHGSSSGSGIESVAGRLLAVTGAGLIIAGSLLPPMASQIRKARRWAVAYPQRRQLFPLWQLLYRAEPGIALDPPMSFLHDAFRVRDAELLLYRRVIEIRDGRLAIATRLDPAVIATTRETALRTGHSPADAAAAAEAAALHHAVHHPHTSSPDDHDTATPPPPQDNPTTLDEEVDWLLRVAHHLHRRNRAGNPTPAALTATPPPRTDP
jgi:hypothetical protein